MSTILDAAERIERAKCLYDVRRYKDAEVELRAALANEEARGTAFYWLCWTLLSQGRLEEAEVAAGRAIAAAPEWGGGNFAHAVVLRKMGRPSQAEGAARSAIRKDPHYAGYRETLGWILLDQGRAREALDLATDSLQQSPDSIGLHQVRTEALRHLGDLSAAGQSALHTASLNPQDEISIAQLGAIAFKQQDLAAAQEYYAKALRLSPSYTFARDGLLRTLRNRTWIYRLLTPKKKIKMTFRMYLALVYLGMMGVMGLVLAPWPVVILPVLLCATILFFLVRSYVGAVFNPLTALALRRNPVGRAALSREEIRCSTYVAVLLVAALLSFLLLALRVWIAGLVGMLLILLVVPVARTFQQTGRVRKVVVLYAIGTAVGGASAIGTLAMHHPELTRYMVTVMLTCWVLMYRRR